MNASTKPELLTAVDAVAVLRLALVQAEYSIKGREHTGFINRALGATEHIGLQAENALAPTVQDAERAQGMPELLAAIDEVVRQNNANGMFVSLSESIKKMKLIADHAPTPQAAPTVQGNVDIPTWQERLPSDHLASGKERAYARDAEIADLRAALAQRAAAAAASPLMQVAPSEDTWQRFTEETQLNIPRLVDVVLTNGVTEYSRQVNRVDWTQVHDWRYAAPVPSAAGADDKPDLLPETFDFIRPTPTPYPPLDRVDLAAIDRQIAVVDAARHGRLERRLRHEPVLDERRSGFDRRARNSGSKT